MISGCVQRLIAVAGCLIIVVVAAALAWTLRDGLTELYRTHVEPRISSEAPEEGPAADAPSEGRPTARSLRRAERKEARIARRDGPAYVVLTADEMAALIESRLDDRAREALDSVKVVLEQDRLVIEAQLVTQQLGGALGPMSSLLGPRESVRAAGPARVYQAGSVRWRPEEFAVRGLPLPGMAIPGLINQITGGKDGSFHIAVPATVGDIRVRPDGVTFYRWVQ